MEERKSSYEGLQANIPELKTPAIETFTNVYVGQSFTIEFSIPEFTAICPKTGLPDFGELQITYIPKEVCLELKSLKEYILFFRDVGIFHENVVNKVCDDLIQTLQPDYLKVHGNFNIRGGIKTRVSREYRSKV